MQPELIAFAVIFIVVVCASLGWSVASESGNGPSGLVLGLLLGPLGVIAAAAMHPSERVTARRNEALADAIAEALFAGLLMESGTSSKPEGEHSSGAARPADDPNRDDDAIDEYSLGTGQADDDLGPRAPAPSSFLTPPSPPLDEPHAGMREGFYVDPFDPTRERYWDGDHWDTETYPRERRTPVATPTSYPGMPPGV